MIPGGPSSDQAGLVPEERAGGSSGAAELGLREQNPRKQAGGLPRPGLGTWSWAGGRGEECHAAASAHTLLTHPLLWVIVLLSTYEYFWSGRQTLKNIRAAIR